jgi:hypothetical protein
MNYENSRWDVEYETLYGTNEGGEIHMGAWYWDHEDEEENWVAVTAADRFGTVIHELTHTKPSEFVQGTTDNGYFLNPDSLEDDFTPVVWQLGGVTVPVTTANLVSNADSYAGYLTQYYYLGVPL